MHSSFLNSDQDLIEPYFDQRGLTAGLPTLCPPHTFSPQEATNLMQTTGVQSQAFSPPINLNYFNFATSPTENWSFVSCTPSGPFPFIDFSSMDTMAHEAIMQPFESLQPLQLLPLNSFPNSQSLDESTAALSPQVDSTHTFEQPSPLSVQKKFTEAIEISPKTGKPKKLRFKATEEELTYLLTIFENNPFPTTKIRSEIAERLGLTEKQILFWFQNRRATLKTNGIIAVKPRVGNPGTTAALAFKKKGGSGGSLPGKSTEALSMSPLSVSNPYFFVKDN
ncbi:hypothetical protein BDR26DRAFT_862358 [Obelidium mucronatum]|nr:hypothetical protein BDR26DRAFT_862358 [Obelidium mucronatum]